MVSPHRLFLQATRQAIATSDPKVAHPALFLDRDGVLVGLIQDAKTGKRRPPHHVNEVEILPGSSHLLRTSSRLGLTNLVVTNQPDVARRQMTVGEARLVSVTFQALLADIDHVYLCPHDNGDLCLNRKPGAGFFYHAAHSLNVNLASSWVVGDRWVDVAAGKAAGVQTILLLRSYSWEASSLGAPPRDLKADHEVTSLSEVADLLTASITHSNTEPNWMARRSNSLLTLCNDLGVPASQ